MSCVKDSREAVRGEPLSVTHMVMGWQDWKVGGFQFRGGSVAGVGTCIGMPELDLVFDVAQGPSISHGAQHILISHGHMDHAAGIPYIMSQRALNKLPAAKVYMPESLVAPMESILRTWAQIEGHEYQYQFVPAKMGDSFALKGDYFFRPFETVHRIPSQGYTVYRKVKKLKTEYQNLSGGELVQLKNAGRPIEDINEEPLVSFTGDTQIEFLDRAPSVKRSRILIMEVTYIDDKKNREEARKWGHTHLDEFVERVGELENERIVLIHLSRRHTIQEARKAVYDRIPTRYHDRVLVNPYWA